MVPHQSASAHCCCNVTAVNLGPRTIPVWRYDTAATVCLSLQTGPGGACSCGSVFVFALGACCCCCCARVMHLSPCIESVLSPVFFTPGVSCPLFFTRFLVFFMFFWGVPGTRYPARGIYRVSICSLHTAAAMLPQCDRTIF